MWARDANRLVAEARQAVSATDGLFIAIDKLLGKLETYLHKRKRKAIARKIAALEERLAALEEHEQGIREKHQGLVQEITHLERSKGKFLLRDLLTVGVSYAVRKGYRGMVQRRLQEGLGDLEAGVAQLRRQGSRIEDRIAYLKNLAQKQNPSLLARFVEFFRKLVQLISAAISFIQGRIVGGLLSVGYVVVAR